MKKIYKVTIAIDVFLLTILALVVYLGCYLGSTSRSQHLIEEKRRIVFKVYNDSDMLFAPDILSDTHDSKKTTISLPNVNMIIVDVPPDAVNMNSILNLHYSVSIGFLPGISTGIVSKALYNGHKVFYRLTIGSTTGGLSIDLNKSEKDNIRTVNTILVSGEYDGIYMSLADAKALDSYPNLSRKIRDSLSFVTVGDTVCYKNAVCYVGPETAREGVQAIFAKVADLSAGSGQWAVVLSYTPIVDAVVLDALLMRGEVTDKETAKITKGEANTDEISRPQNETDAKSSNW